MTRRGLIAAVMILGAGAPSVCLAATPVTLSDCDAKVRREPRSSESYRCYEAVARRGNQWADAALRLDAILSLNPGNHLAGAQLAHVEAIRGGARAESLYRAALTGLAGGGESRAEVRTRLDFSIFLRLRGRQEEAESEARLAAEISERSGDPEAIASVRIGEAWLAYRRSDLAEAWRLLSEAEKLLSPDAADYLESDWLSAMGAVHWAMGQHRVSLEDYGRQAALLHRLDDLHEEAVARSNMVLLALTLTPDRPMTPAERNGLIHLVQEALDMAVAGGNRAIEAKAHLYMAQVVESATERRQHIGLGLDLSRQMGNMDDAGLALRLMAQSLVAEEPREIERGFRLIEELLAEATSKGSIVDIALAWSMRARVEWDLARAPDAQGVLRDRAVASSLAALDAVESIRDRQADSLVRARTLSGWVSTYREFTGNLLWNPGGAPLPEAVAMAFQVSERMRARVLLDALDTAQATVVLSPESPEAKRLGQRSEEIYAFIRSPALATPGQLRASLADDEAFLLFQVAGRTGWRGTFLGGSWLMVLTRNESRLFQLPDEPSLISSVDLFTGLFRSRDGTEAAAASRLYRDLLADALREMPAGIKRLVISADGPLHLLPFVALRADADADPLGLVYEVSVVPSATVWLRLREISATHQNAPVLALADPDLTVSGSGAKGSVSKVLTRGSASLSGLAPLPRAREEARAIVRQVGRGSRQLEGPAATELMLKRMDLAPFGIVHLAVHAVVDDMHPERSALVLAPGSDSEDGLLQMREIVGLDLTGRVVVLSACRSASGEMLRGEGVLSLARAFFVAGARAVVSSLWPLRDDEAAGIFERFYVHLAEGLTLGDALREARRDMIRAGAPPEAWAGVTLLGDGDLVPYPDGRGSSPVLRPAVFALVLLLCAAAGLALIAYLRRSPSAPHDSH